MAEHDAPGPDEPRHGPDEETARESSWDDVAAQFSSLGKQLRRRFEQPAGADRETSSEAESEAGSAPGREGARRWIDTLDDTFTKLGDTVRDPAFRKEAGSSVSRLGEALGASLRDVGEQLQRRFGARHDPPGSAGERVPDVPSPPASASEPGAGGEAPTAPSGGDPTDGPTGGPPPPPAGDPPPAPPADGTPPPAPPADRPQDPPPTP